MWRIYSVHNVLFILHRVTGIALVAYLVAHIFVVSTALLWGGDVFARVMAFFAGPNARALEIALLGCILFHALNGLRIIWGESEWLLAGRRRLALLTIGTTLATWALAGSVAILV